MNCNWLSALPASARVSTYFLLQALLGSRIGRHWREFRAWTHLSPAELNRAVDQRLGALLTHASGAVPIYREGGLARWPGESAAGFLRRFPVLTRATVRERFAELVADSHREAITSPESVSRRRYDWIVVKTGGTTGVPTAVVHDAACRDAGRAGRLFSQQMCGFPLGTRYFRLWGSEQDLLQQRESTQRAVLRNLLGEVPLNAFRATEADLRRHLSTIFSHPRVHHLMAYVDAAASLASFVEDQHLVHPHFHSLMACAGTVTPEWRELLGRVFQTEVFDKYGSRECTDIACECSAHSGLHIYSPNVFVEVVDDLGQACPPGVTGRILVTLLHNFTFPLIRYEIGDMGTLAGPEHCPCGLAFPKIENVQGRKDDMLLTSDGMLITSGVVRHFVGVSLNRELIREWQLEQTGLDAFTFRYIPRQRGGLESNLRDLQTALKKAFGAGAEIQAQEVTEIPPSPSGKARWIINRMNQPTTT